MIYECHSSVKKIDGLTSEPLNVFLFDVLFKKNREESKNFFILIIN